MFRNKIQLLGVTLLEFFFRFIGVNVYGVAPPIESSPSPSWIYDFLPESPIAVNAAGRVESRWDWPGDFVLDRTYPADTRVAITTDDQGSNKIYEYDGDAGVILLHSGWGATVTKEGSIVYHGPRNDPRGEVAILVPYGYGLQGFDAGEDLLVVQSIEFTQGNWERDPAYDRQVYTILYNTDSDPRLIVQEITWDTDTLAPVVKTTYPDEHFHRYEIKEFEPYWYMATSQVPAIHRYAPTPVFRGVRRVHMQMRTAINNLDALKAKYAAESSKFDAYRRSAGIV